MKLIEKIVSGGQTGVDRAGLDAAIDRGVPYGGWLPKGRKAEDGPLDAKYDQMSELNSDNYIKRTEQNVIDSDATIIFCHGKPTGGTQRTIDFCKKHLRPYEVFNLDDKDPDTTPSLAVADAIEYLCWQCARDSIILNVAGPRGSKDPGIYEEVRDVLGRAISNVNASEDSVLSGRRDCSWIPPCALGEGKRKRYVERKGEEKRPIPALVVTKEEDVQSDRVYDVVQRGDDSLDLFDDENKCFCNLKCATGADGAALYLRWAQIAMSNRRTKTSVDVYLKMGHEMFGDRYGTGSMADLKCVLLFSRFKYDPKWPDMISRLAHEGRSISETYEILVEREREVRNKLAAGHYAL